MEPVKTQQIPTQSEATPPPIPPKPKKSFLKNPFFWIIVVALFIFTGTYYYLYANLNNQVSRLTSMHNTPKLSPTPTIVLPADWKTYINKGYSYTFSYPSSWKITGDPRYTDLDNLGSLELKSPCEFDKGDYCSDLSISVSPYDPKTGLQTNFRRDGPADKNIEKLTRFKNQEAKEIYFFQGNYGNGGTQPSGKLLYILLIHRGPYLYTIEYEERNNNTVATKSSEWYFEKILNQILESFSFTPLTSYKEPVVRKLTTYTTEELSGFPVYPNSSFIEKQIVPKSTMSVINGYSLWNTNTYEFSSTTDGDMISTFYFKDISKDGWKCHGGGGQYGNSRDFFSKVYCNKETKEVTLFLTATPSATTILIGIPNY